MNKFIIDTEADKAKVTNALVEAKIDAKVRQHMKDIYAMEFTADDIPGEDEPADKFESLADIESSVRAAVSNILKSSDDEDDDDDTDEDDDE